MYEQQKALVENVVEQMSICADLVGAEDASKISKYGFVPGLNENEMAKNLQSRIATIENGIFQVMFTGCFNAGKSTLINALLRRNVLKTSSTPETAVITKIFFNAEEEKVIIYKRTKFKNDGQASTDEMYDLNEFFKKYTIDEKDREKFLRTVNHVEMFLRSNGIAGSMVQFVDSPGTQASTADDLVSLKFVEHADAVVFLVSAVAAMDQFDKEYIARRFANRQMKNIFFVVNRKNQLNTPQDLEDVKQRMRDELSEVFTDANGNFNQDLYDRRVFFINAFGSLNTRIGRETPEGVDGRTRMIPDDETGVPQFERVLGEFLTSGDKDKLALSAYRSQMASFFVAAEKAVNSRNEYLCQGIRQNERILIEYENDKAEIERTIQDIKSAIEQTELNILRDLKDSYEYFLTELDEKWDTYFAEKAGSMQISFVTLLIAQADRSLAFWRDREARERNFDEKTRAATQAFADGIQNYLAERREDFSRVFELKIRNNLAKLTVDLEKGQKKLEGLHLPISVEEIIDKIILEKNIPIKGIGENKSKLGQAFFAICFADPELLISASGGEKDTMDFIADIVKTNILDVVLGTILVAFIGNIFALIGFVLYKIFKARNKNQDMTRQLIAETKFAILNGYNDKDGNKVSTGLRGEYRAKFINDTYALVNAVIRRAGTQLTEGIENNLAEIEENLKKTNDLLAKDKAAIEKENDRMNKILDTMAQSISQISILTNDTALTKADIRALAVSTN